MTKYHFFLCGLLLGAAYAFAPNYDTSAPLIGVAAVVFLHGIIPWREIS